VVDAHVTHSLGYLTDLALRRGEGSLITAQPGPDGPDRPLTVISTPANPTYWWGNFLLMPKSPAPGDLPVWLKTFQTAFPDADHRAFGVDTVDGDTGAVEEFVDAGFEVNRDTVLTALRTQPPRRPATDVVVRRLGADGEWEAAVNLALAVNAADPDGLEASSYETFTRARLASYRRVQDAGAGGAFGAFDDTGVMLSGLGIFDAGQSVARYQHVETRPQARSRGLAGTLVHAAAQWAADAFGTTTLVIVADPEYHAIGLYERLGFSATQIQIGFERRPLHPVRSTT
jgi:GNAT superfamily N-acetyltransferase